MKHSIPDLYRREWLDIAAHVYISALLNLGTVRVDGEDLPVNMSAEDAIKRFQKWLNLTEDQLDTDALKSTYYRNQRRFIEVMKKDIKNINMSKKTEAMYQEDEVQELVSMVIGVLKEKNKVSM